MREDEDKVQAKIERTYNWKQRNRPASTNLWFDEIKTSKILISKNKNSNKSTIGEDEDEIQTEHEHTHKPLF